MSQRENNTSTIARLVRCRFHSAPLLLAADYIAPPLPLPRYSARKGVEKNTARREGWNVSGYGTTIFLVTKRAKTSVQASFLTRPRFVILFSKLGWNLWSGIRKPVDNNNNKRVSFLFLFFLFCLVVEKVKSIIKLEWNIIWVKICTYSAME